ncbi:MAG: benzoylformate decarboxylase [Candidatus Sulfotelmatobacter sp.]|jgi:benzoylformate decarboxylase
MRSVREATYEVMRELGMTTIFGNPGSTELPFLRNLPVDFKYVLALHERSAAGMGVGYAMARGKAAFVNLHSVASVGNGLAAIVDAHYCHAPLVVTAGQQDRRQIQSEPFLASRSVDVAKPYVKWAWEPVRAEDVPAAIARGYYLAMRPPMGPVFISIPMDDWTHSCESQPVRITSGTVLADREALREIVYALDHSQNPSLVAGSQIEEDRGWNEVIALAEHLDADVYQEPIASRWTFPRRHRLFRGHLLPAQRPLAEQLSAYDLVVVLGAPIFLYYAYVPGETVTPATKLFQITNSPHDAAAALAGRSIVGDVAEAANYLLRNSKPRSRGARTARNLPAEVHAAHPITPAYLFNVLNKLLPRDAIICEECPSSKGDLDAHILLDEPGSFYSVRSGILGFGLPAAVGLQLAHPERRVVCPVGDGSVQYSIQALWTAVQENAPVIFIVLHNGDYSALKSFCDFTRVGRDVPGMDLPAIDIVKIAGGYGMASSRVERCEELAPVLREAFSSKRPCLISVRVTPGGDKCMGMDHSVNPPDYR